MDPFHQSHYDYNYDPRDPYSYQGDARFSEPRRHKSRASSVAASESVSQTAQQPLRNALKNAFDKSDSGRDMHPEVIAQITADVKRSVLDEIKMNQMGGTNQAPPPFPPSSPYTPPSPKHSDPFSHGFTSPGTPSRNSMYDSTDRRDSTVPIDIPQVRTGRRPAPSRMPTEEAYTPIEKMWQRLFDPQGQQPTPRLGQFLRGLAIHLIEDYEPKNSLVITPSKMIRFYDDVKLDEEIYPWATIFGRLSYPALSKIYRDMRCQYHFVQERPTDEPRIPALTPLGFQEWMTAMILAYPNNEYERLAKTVLNMPISNADDPKERFPKELPRRLFPPQENLQAQQRCAAILSAEKVGPLRRAPAFPPPPPPPLSTPGLSTSFERERSPYASKPHDHIIMDDDDDHIGLPSKPIERERKPYTVAPGGAKVFEDGRGHSHSHSVPPEMAMNDPGRRSQGRWVPPPLSRVPPEASRIPSDSYIPPDSPRVNLQAIGRRSPPSSGYGRRPEPPVRAPSTPSTGYYTNPYESDEDDQRITKDAENRRNEWIDRHGDGAPTPHHQRHSTVGTDASYDSQHPRSVFDDEYYARKASNGYDARGYDARRY
ncbi:hypothetical protein P280DRAFT_454540 [Massarina eburnea CBS 473.64]|uniref:DUF7514 domain-containing protein n=1 Tax=Massarina eburnea CBS 473.64 TaxID=1395130 RepID=A0A6A6RVX1_9PLEO|nr:hypothetical protein P280DRAFT_454540 [Massarina eburnea CBS 473.64]